MIVVERTDERFGPRRRQIVALFGAGLIGRSILTAFGKGGAVKARELPFTWNAEHRQLGELETIQQYILASYEDATISPVTAIDIVWAAGRSGFASPKDQTLPEVRAFEKILFFGLQLLGYTADARHSFHFISSAGGLFEGQRHVGQANLARPLRPYGHAKMQQERLLSGLPAPIRKMIYRPSSVYGFSGKGLRLGLVSTLVQNTIRHQASKIFGNSLTIRDYVLASDVGEFIAGRLRDFDKTSGIFTLASGKPTTIFEVLTRIERILGRKTFHAFDKARTNAMDICFSPAILPHGWHPTDLETGLRQTVHSLILHQV
jgi:UDP-glucose 4-epimerase